MLDIKDFSIFENQSGFDFKGFLIKIASYWKWFVISLTLAFTIAYQVNIRKEKIYTMETLIAVKEENNPFFIDVCIKVPRNLLFIFFSRVFFV